MACINPLKIKNPRYLPNKTNGGNPPFCTDPRDKSITVPCGRCVECRRRRATDWRFRMHQEYRYHDTKRFHFVSFTFSEESLAELRELVDEYEDDNIVVKRAVRLFLERYRKKYKVSLKHLFITELGENGGRIHLHGVIIDCKCGVWKRGKYYADIPTLSSLWSYGHIWVGWCTDASISYILKYIMKQDPEHPDFRALLLVSPGLGKAYCSDANIRLHHSVPGYIWYCRTSSGHKIGMPRYYRLKIFTDDEREARKVDLWENPPPLVYRGREFTDPWEYKAFIESRHRESLRLGTSYKKTPHYTCNIV